MESRRWEDINAALLRSEQRDEAMFKAITMVTDSVRNLSIHAPGLAPNFHPPSAAAYSAHVAWPEGPAQQQGEGDAADDDEESEEESEEEDEDEEEEESDEVEEDEEED
ncbi:armadillo-like helical domain-containing protein 4 [Cajanus cajan]|nr:armadillo-like helical domain-containing protein 4 [Cajanus cajan]